MTGTLYPAFSLLGAPGCGKGTQAQIIQERLGFLHVSSGDIFRGAIAKGDPIALEVQEMMQRGELIPDEIIRDLMAVELDAKIKETPGIKGVTLDGFPRTVGQAKLLEDLLAKVHLYFTAMVTLNVPTELLVERLMKRGSGSEQRPDDNEDVIRERMRVWHEKTYPLEEYYRKHNLLIEIDGIGTIEEIYQRLEPIIKQWEVKEQLV